MDDPKTEVNTIKSNIFSENIEYVRISLDGRGIFVFLEDIFLNLLDLQTLGLLAL